MNSQEQPLITLFMNFPGSEEGDRWRVKMEREEEEELEPLIKLGLGIGEYCNTSNTINRSTSDDIKWQKDNNFGRIVVKSEVFDSDDHDYDRTVERGGCRMNSVVRFTEEQMEELKRQLIIFKYMVWGLPVPIQLLFPLWRTPSFYVWRKVVNNRCLVMDPEPGRCRRTDGKKWRCYQFVVPNEKYCEKHMHRGRKRSRKLVETPTTTPPNEDTNTSKNPHNDLGVDVPAILDRKSLLLNDTTRNVSRPPWLTSTSAKSNDNEELNNVGQHKSVMKERIAAMSLASGLEFSPKSVLQDGQRCTRVGIRVNALDVLRRCNRTDGKKWQCNHEALTGQKYCPQHVRRGSKKLAVALSVGRETKADRVSSSAAKFTGQEQAKMGLNLDSDLNSSVHSNEDSVAGSSSSSDPGTETTISDDNGGGEVSIM